MKRQLQIVAPTCFGAALSLGTALAASAATPDSADAKAQVLAVTQAWVEAENKHDAGALAGILDDKFISTYAANKPIGKDRFIKGITKGPVDPTQSQSLTDETVVVDGDTAVIVGDDTFHSATKPPSAPLRFTITYVRRDGHWQALGEHIVSIPPKP